MSTKTYRAYYADVSLFGNPALILDNVIYVKIGEKYIWHSKLEEKIPREKKKFIRSDELARMMLAGEIE